MLDIKERNLDQFYVLFQKIERRLKMWGILSQPVLQVKINEFNHLNMGTG